MHEAAGCIDQPRCLLPAQYGGQALVTLRKRDLIGHVGPAERLDKQEPQRCGLPLNGVWRELAVAEQMYLVLTDVIRPKLIRRTPKVSGELLHSLNVTTNRVPMRSSRWWKCCSRWDSGKILSTLENGKKVAVGFTGD